MANHKSAKKRIKQTVKRTERNRYYRTRFKNIVKAVREAVEAGNKEAAVELRLLKLLTSKFTTL